MRVIVILIWLVAIASFALLIRRAPEAVEDERRGFVVIEDPEPWSDTLAAVGAFAFVMIVVVGGLLAFWWTVAP